MIHLFPALLAACLVAASARADVFLLHSGGEVRGELLNPDQKPRAAYTIRTASGGQVTVQAAQVKQVIRQSPAEIEYDRLRPTYPDTVDGQWALAAWCLDHKLTKQRKVHLERVVALDADHLEARRALGFQRKDGRWVTQEMLMTEQGYVKYKGEWRLPQEVELAEQRRNSELAEKAWFAKLKRWRGWLGTDRDPQAVAGIEAIDDPQAVKALAQFLKDETDRQVREMFVAALAKVGTPPAFDVLADRALHAADEETRLASLEALVASRYPGAVPFFIKALQSKDNVLVNRGGAALEWLGDPAAIGPLIDALETVHKFKIVKGQPGQMSSTFGTGGTGNPGGFSFGGGGSQIVKQPIRNKDVLRALVKLSGVNFDFDHEAWKSWFASQRKPKSLDARRD
jgi:hypothetical protein